MIRQEISTDYPEVSSVIAAAFHTVEISDHREHLMVERLRKAADFIPELSLVYTIDEQIVGHILLSKIQIVNGEEQYESLALAPVAVLPTFQKKGIGGKLISEAHKRASALGFTSIVLLGHAAYYPRFGYQVAGQFGIRLPFEVPAENVMAIELQSDSLKDISGTVVYPKAFFE